LAKHRIARGFEKISIGLREQIDVFIKSNNQKKRKNSVKDVRAIVDLSHTRFYAALERRRNLAERRRLRVGLFCGDRVKILEKS
jgi:hypothetical protein